MSASGHSANDKAPRHEDWVSTRSEPADKALTRIPTVRLNVRIQGPLLEAAKTLVHYERQRGRKISVSKIIVQALESYVREYDERIESY